MSIIETREWRTVDKSAWGPGEWQSEPDKVQWQDEATGLPCLIVRGPQGALCGYVGVREGHPFYGVKYDLTGRVDAHGGLTFSDFCQPAADEARGICHLTSGEDRVWWLGFDCAHYLDLCPAGWGCLRDGDYWNIADVRSECTSLARQLADVTQEVR